MMPHHRGGFRGKLIARIALLKMQREWFAGGDGVQLFRIIIVLLVIGNAIAIALVLNLFSNTLRGEFSLAFGLVAATILVSLLLDFVPATRALGLYRVGFHPTDWKDRFLLWLTTDLIGPTQALLLLNLTLLSMSTAIDIFTYLSLLGSVLFARLVSLLIRLRLDYIARVREYGVAGITAGVAILLTVAGLAGGGWEITTVSVMGGIVVALVPPLLSTRYFFQQPPWAFVRRADSLAVSINSRIFQRLPTKLLVSISFGFLFKILFLGLNVLHYSSDGTFLFESEILFALFLSPTVVFTYALNNLYAFDPAFYYNIELRTGRWKIFLQRYFAKVLPCIVVDTLLVLTIIYWAVGWQWVIDSSPFYFGSIGILIGLGFWGSVYFPYAIRAGGIATSYRTYTHPLTSAVSIAAILSLYFASNYLPPVLIITSSLLVGGTFFGLATNRLASSRVNIIREIVD